MPERLRATAWRLIRQATLILLFVCVASAVASAQDAASPQAVLFGGGGFIAQSGLHHAFQIGGALDEAPPNLGGGFYIEAGFMASRVPSNTAFASFNYMSAWHFGESSAIRDRSGRVIGWSDRGWKTLPFVTAGYTRLFSVGNAFNFGGGLDYRLDHTTALRFEVRDYDAWKHPGHNYVVFRIGFVVYIPD